MKEKTKNKSRIAQKKRYGPGIAGIGCRPMKHRIQHQTAATVFKVLTTQQPSYLANIIRFRAASRQLPPKIVLA